MHIQLVLYMGTISGSFAVSYTVLQNFVPVF